MFRVGKRTISYLLVFVIAIHLTWSVLVVIGPQAALDQSVIRSIYHFFPEPWTLAAVLFFASVAAIVGVWRNEPYAALWFVPQQIVLLAIASWSMDVIYTGQAFVGDIRDRYFIAINQTPYLWLSVIHLMALVSLYRSRVREHDG